MKEPNPNPQSYTKMGREGCRCLTPTPQVREAIKMKKGTFMLFSISEEQESQKALKKRELKVQTESEETISKNPT